MLVDRELEVLFNKITTRFGVPKGVAHELKNTKKAVGDVIAKMEMIERRQ